MQDYLQRRLMSLQHDFRQSPVWSFWYLDRLFKNDLYFRNPKNLRKRNPTTIPDGSDVVMVLNRKRAASAAGLDDPSARSEDSKQDNYEMLVGSVGLRRRPESGGWWKSQQRS